MSAKILGAPILSARKLGARSTITKILGAEILGAKIHGAKILSSLYDGSIPCNQLALLLELFDCGNREEIRCSMCHHKFASYSKKFCDYSYGGSIPSNHLGLPLTLFYMGFLYVKIWGGGIFDPPD